MSHMTYGYETRDTKKPVRERVKNKTYQTKPLLVPVSLIDSGALFNRCDKMSSSVNMLCFSKMVFYQLNLSLPFPGAECLVAFFPKRP
jgi:hypothetical protein